MLPAGVISAAGQVLLSGAGGGGGGDVSGSGAATRLAEWTGSTSLGASTLIKTGAGVLTLDAGGGYTLTIPATGTVALGTGAATRLTEWTGTNTLGSSTLIKTGVGVLTLDAGGAYTLTIPATGTVALGTGAATRLAEWTGTNTLGSSTLIKTGAGVLTLSVGSDFTLTVPKDGAVVVAAGASAGNNIARFTTADGYTVGGSNEANIFLSPPNLRLAYATDINSLPPQFTFARGRSGPAAVQSGDVLGELNFQGYGTAYATGGRLRAIATQTWSGSVQGTNLFLGVARTGATAISDLAYLGADGTFHVGVGDANSSPVGLKVDVSSHATSRRAALALDVWQVGQDINANGTKDFFVYDGANSRTNLLIDTSGNTRLFGALRLNNYTDLSLQMRAVTVNNGSTAQLLNTASVIAYAVVINNQTGASAVFMTRGGAAGVYEASDPSTTFSATAGTGSSTNIYWSAGNSRYEIQNNTGIAVTYYVFYVALA